MVDNISMKEALRISEIRYRRIFDKAKDGIIMLDGESGCIVDVNPCLLSLLGYSLNEVVGKQLWEVELFDDVEAGKEAFDQLKKNAYIHYNDLELKTKNGGMVHVEFVSNVYPAGGGMTIQCTISDITARRNAEKKLHETETQLGEQLRRSREMNTFGIQAERFARDFNTVFASILASAEAIAETSDIKLNAAIYVSRIIEAAKRGMIIVTQMLIFAHSK